MILILHFMSSCVLEMKNIQNDVLAALCRLWGHINIVRPTTTETPENFELRVV